MFEILPNPSLETVLIAIRGMVLIGAIWVFAMAFTRWRRNDERATQALHAQLERAFNELRSLNETVSVMSARLDAFSERADIEPKALPPATLNAQRGYDVATRLAKQGASVEDLVANCGITRHEAELLTRLHGAKVRNTPSPSWQRAAAKNEAPAQVQWPVQQREEAPPAPVQKGGRKRGSLVSVVG
ncbi:MAG TPA: DUF2802 domain-containing protein [Steroidobacteraceae bacterium]|nr:DUF2802 domain-containing protein [Steroidobacteraceae bacterium]